MTDLGLLKPMQIELPRLVLPLLHHLVQELALASMDKCRKYK